MADPTRYAAVGPVELWLGDAATTLALLPGSSVDAVVTSPPYWGLRDYGTGRWAGGDPTCPHPCGPQAAPCGCGAVWTDPQYGLEATLDGYLGHLTAVFDQVHRVLTPGGTCWVNLGDGYVSAAGGAPASGPPYRGGRRTPRPRAQDLLAPKNLLGVPWRVALRLQQRGWILFSGSRRSSGGTNLRVSAVQQPSSKLYVPQRLWCKHITVCQGVLLADHFGPVLFATGDTGRRRV